jgi:hypothetical protein
VSPEVNALATLFLAVVFVLVALPGWLMGREERRRRAAASFLPFPPSHGGREEGWRLVVR